MLVYALVIAAIWIIGSATILVFACMASSIANRELGIENSGCQAFDNSIFDEPITQPVSTLLRVPTEIE